jgi:hypothetical protein
MASTVTLLIKKFDEKVAMDIVFHRKKQNSNREKVWEF